MQSIRSQHDRSMEFRNPHQALTPQPQGFLNSVDHTDLQLVLDLFSDELCTYVYILELSKSFRHFHVYLYNYPFVIIHLQEGSI